MSEACFYWRLKWCFWCCKFEDNYSMVKVINVILQEVVILEKDVLKKIHQLGSSKATMWFYSQLLHVKSQMQWYISKKVAHSLITFFIVAHAAWLHLQSHFNLCQWKYGLGSHLFNARQTMTNPYASWKDIHKKYIKHLDKFLQFLNLN